MVSTKPAAAHSNALCIREVMLYRVSELADAAFACYQKDQLVASATLARALFESFALLYWIFKEMKHAVKDGSSSKVKEIIRKALIGTRDGSSALDAHNVLKAIDFVTKDVASYRMLYGKLCEIAHPNYGGGLGAYAKFNKEKVWWEFRTSRLPKPLILGPLVGTLEAFIDYYDRMMPLIKQFAALCDREVSSK